MKKIIWAVDAFSPEASLEKASVALLKNLATKTRCKIEPVYILSPDQLNLSVEFTPPWVEQYRPAAEKAIQSAMEKSGIPNIVKPKVIVQKIPSLRSAVKGLSAHALSSGADAIVVGTHARQGLPRFFLGSFTEALLIASKVPIISVNPETKFDSINHIVYSTDFSKESEAVFKKVVSLAKALNAKVSLFHHVQNPIEPIIQSGVYLLGGGWVSVSAYMAEEVETAEKLAKEMAAKFKKEGIPIEIFVDSGRQGIADSLLAFAEKNNAGMIAMAAESGPVAATLIGSVARQVVRGAHCPTWVVHAPPAAKKRKR